MTPKREWVCMWCGQPIRGTVLVDRDPETGQYGPAHARCKEHRALAKLFKGGQGRSASEIAHTAEAGLWLLCGAVVVLAAVLAAAAL